MPLIRTIATPSETDAFTLSGVAGERVHITVADEGATAFTPVWRLLTPGGTGSSGCSAFTAASLDCVLATSGTYTVEVQESGQDATGTYSVHAQRLTNGRRCGETISCGTPIAAALGFYGRADTNLHSFDAVAGERVSVALTPQNGTLFNPEARILGPDGVTVCGFRFVGITTARCRDGVVRGGGCRRVGGWLRHLPAANPAADRRASMRRTIACGTPINRTMAMANLAETDLHSFDAIAGERVSVALANEGGPRFNPVWRILGPTGSLCVGLSRPGSAIARCRRQGRTRCRWPTGRRMAPAPTDCKSSG